MPLVFAFATGLLCTELLGDKLEKKLRYALYDVFLDSFPDYAPNFTDSLGIPYTFYPEQNGITPGFVYNATIVANYAIDYFRDLQRWPEPVTRERFGACIRWLETNISEVNGHALYLFEWRQPWYPKVSAPFTSGMTSGRAIEALTYAFQFDNDSMHLKNAAKLVKGFDLEVGQGGFTFKEQHGWWYEEIADTSGETPRILDGHIFCLTGLHIYFKQTGDSLAKAFFDSGVKALKASLPAYDRGDGYVFYDKYKKLADENYHLLLVQQMVDLYAITGDTLFKQFEEKWGAPLRKPYLYRIIRDGNKTGCLLLIIFSGVSVLIVGVSIRIFKPKIA